jgi:hypothetical protein
LADTAGGSPNGLYVKSADGTGETEKLLSSEEGRQLHARLWSSDGKALLLQEFITWTNFDICVLSMDKDHVKSTLLQTEYSEGWPEISPDGRWLAYRSNESNKYNIYVRPFPETDTGKWMVSTDGGNSPLWAPDMQELYYLSEDNHAMAVEVNTEPTIRFGTPRVLFENKNLGPNNPMIGTPWDIHPDGKRFLMMKPVVPGSEAKLPKPKITIVLNWFEELKAKVSVD